MMIMVTDAVQGWGYKSAVSSVSLSPILFQMILSERYRFSAMVLSPNLLSCMHCVAMVTYVQLVMQQMQNYVYMLDPDLMPSPFYTAETATNFQSIIVISL